jgi:hypothetical protein
MVSSCLNEPAGTQLLGNQPAVSFCCGEEDLAAGRGFVAKPI